MTDSEPPPLKRLKLSRKELEELSKDELIERWLQQEQYVDVLEARNSEGQKDSLELVSLRESEDKMRQQQLEATRRENLLVMRLAAKEQEMQDYASQIQDLKQVQMPGSTQLRSTLLDPAVNLMFERMKKELNSTKAKLEETQNELSAWKFTPDSNTGKRLMAKCRLLYQENEELGKMISSGRMAKLEGDLALQKNFSAEMKKSQTEMDEFLLELDEDVEGMQSTIVYLQQQLRDSKEQISRLQTEIQQGQTDHSRSSAIENTETINNSSSSPKSSPFTTAFKITENGSNVENTSSPLAPPSLTNHVKSCMDGENGSNNNGPILRNGEELRTGGTIVNNAAYISANAGNDSVGCDAANLNPHSSPEERGATNNGSSSSCRRVEDMITDEDDKWFESSATPPQPPDKDEEMSPVMNERQLAAAQDNLTIEQQLEAMEEECSEDLARSHTPPPKQRLCVVNEDPGDNEEHSCLPRSPSDKTNVILEGRDHPPPLSSRNVAQNGAVDGSSSISDEDDDL